MKKLNEIVVTKTPSCNPPQTETIIVQSPQRIRVNEDFGLRLFLV